MTTDFAPRRARLAESEELQIETPAANGVYANSLLTLSCIACLSSASRAKRCVKKMLNELLSRTIQRGSWMPRAVLHSKKARHKAEAGDLSHALERKPQWRRNISERAIRRCGLAGVRCDFPARTVNASCSVSIDDAAAGSRCDAAGTRAHRRRTEQKRNRRWRVDAHIRQPGVRISRRRRGYARRQIQFPASRTRCSGQRARGGRSDAIAIIRRSG